MAYGFRIKVQRGGNTTYDSSLVTWLQIGFFLAPANTTTTMTFTDADQFSEFVVQQWFINTPPEDQESFSHTVVLSNSNKTVTVSGGNETQGILYLGR